MNGVTSQGEVIFGNRYLIVGNGVAAIVMVIDQSLKIGSFKGSPTPPKFSSTMGESEPAWVKYANAIGVLALLTGIIYFNPLGGSPSLPTFSSLSSIPMMFGAFRLQSIQGAPLVDLPATLPNGCPAHKFKSVRHLSRAPHIMVIEGFLSPEEADALLELAYPSPFFGHPS